MCLIHPEGERFVKTVSQQPMYIVQREAAKRRKDALRHGGEAGDKLEEVFSLCKCFKKKTSWN